MDRKLYARLQNRVGPPWFQPLADFIKLVAKEDIVPDEADRRMFKLMPMVALAAAVTAFLYIPVWGTQRAVSFDGDLIVVLYLLTIPTLTFFLAGWYSSSVYSMLGAVRSLTQLFAYEVPLFLAVLAPALLADTLVAQRDRRSTRTIRPTPPSTSSASSWPRGPAGQAGEGALRHPRGRDRDRRRHASPSTAAGCWRCSVWPFDMEMVVGAALLAAVFLPFGPDASARRSGFVLYLLKVLLIVALSSLLRTVLARLRIDQMIDFCWKVLAPVAFVQLLIDLVVKGVIGR